MYYCLYVHTYSRPTFKPTYVGSLVLQGIQFIEVVFILLIDYQTWFIFKYFRSVYHNIFSRCYGSLTGGVGIHNMQQRRHLNTPDVSPDDTLCTHVKVIKSQGDMLIIQLQTLCVLNGVNYIH